MDAGLSPLYGCVSREQGLAPCLHGVGKGLPGEAAGRALAVVSEGNGHGHQGPARAGRQPRGPLATEGPIPELAAAWKHLADSVERAQAPGAQAWWTLWDVRSQDRLRAKGQRRLWGGCGHRGWDADRKFGALNRPHGPHGSGGQGGRGWPSRGCGASPCSWPGPHCAQGSRVTSPSEPSCEDPCGDPGPAGTSGMLAHPQVLPHTCETCGYGGRGQACDRLQLPGGTRSPHAVLTATCLAHPQRQGTRKRAPSGWQGRPGRGVYTQAGQIGPVHLLCRQGGAWRPGPQ